jgi:VCBS repeat protein
MRRRHGSRGLGIGASIVATMAATASANDRPSPAVSVDVGTIDVARALRVVVAGRPMTPFALGVSLFPDSLRTRYGIVCLNPRRAVIVSDGIFRRHDPPLDEAGRYDRTFTLGETPWLLGRTATFQAIVVDPNGPHGLSLSRSESRVIGNGSRGDFRGPTIAVRPGERVYGVSEPADVDGDGDVDLLVVQGAGYRLLLNDGTGSFVDGTEGPWSGLPTDRRRLGYAEFVDVDGDGDLDLVGFAGGIDDYRLYLLVNDGRGLFVDGTDGATTGTPVQPRNAGLRGEIAVGDFDGDGSQDLVLLGDGRIYLNDGHGRFRDVTHGPGGWSNPMGGDHAVVGDFDEDGDLDLVTSYGGGPSYLCLNDGHAFFSDGSNGPSTGLPQAGNWGFQGLLAGDLDRDGDLDLVMKTYGGQTQIWINQGGGLFFDETFSGPDGLPRIPIRPQAIDGAVLADIDRDGDLDFYASDRLNGIDVLYLNDGRGVFADASGNPRSGASQTWSVYRHAFAADFDGDGDLDILAEGGDAQQPEFNAAILVNR